MSIKITALYERLSRDDEMQGENDFERMLAEYDSEQSTLEGRIEEIKNTVVLRSMRKTQSALINSWKL